MIPIHRFILIPILLLHQITTTTSSNFSTIYRYRHDTYIPLTTPLTIASTNFPSIITTTTPYSIDLVSKTLLSLTVHYSDYSTTTIKHQDCCPKDSFGLHLFHPCFERCIVITTYTVDKQLVQQTRYVDTIGSISQKPWTSVTRRLVIQFDNTAAAVAINGVALIQKDFIKWQTRSIAATTIASSSALVPPFLLIHGPGILHQLTVNTHWTLANAMVPDLHISLQSASQRRWDWWQPFTTDTAVILSPLHNQQFQQGKDVALRVAVRQSMHSFDTWCMSIRATYTMDRMMTRCYMHDETAQELAIVTTDLHVGIYILDVFLIKQHSESNKEDEGGVSVVTKEKEKEKLLASSKFAIVAVSLNERQAKELRLVPAAIWIGLGDLSIPPLRLSLDLASIQTMDEQLRTFIHLNTPVMKSKIVQMIPMDERCKVMYWNASHPQARWRAPINIADNYNVLEQLHLLKTSTPNELLPNTYCNINNNQNQNKDSGVNNVQEEAEATEELGMPCMSSGQSLCFPPTAALPIYQKWWIEAIAQPEALQLSSSNVQNIQHSILHCNRTDMSFEAVENCYCQNCGYSANNSQVYVSSNRTAYTTFAPPPPRPIYTSRHSRIFPKRNASTLKIVNIHQTNYQEKKKTNIENNNTMQCNALKLSNMNLHTAAIGTAFNIYHVMFDLLQPLYEWQTSHTEVKVNTILSLSPHIIFLKHSNKSFFF